MRTKGAVGTLTGAGGSLSTTTDNFGDFWFEWLEVGNFALKIESDGNSKTLGSISTEKDVNLGDILLS